MQKSQCRIGLTPRALIKQSQQRNTKTTKDFSSRKAASGARHKGTLMCDEGAILNIFFSWFLALLCHFEGQK